MDSAILIDKLCAPWLPPIMHITKSLLESLFKTLSKASEIQRKAQFHVFDLFDTDGSEEIEELELKKAIHLKNC